MAIHDDIGRQLLERVENTLIGNYTERDHVLAAVADAVEDLLIHDRDDDAALPLGKVEDAIRSGLVTVDEMAALFRAGLIAAVEDSAERECTVEGVPR